MIHNGTLSWICIVGLLVGVNGAFVFADPPLGGVVSQKERQYRGGRKSGDGTEGRRNSGHRRDRKHGSDKNKSHVHKWKSHRNHHREGQGKKGEGWKKRWHKGHDFDKHRSHTYNKHGWFWEDETKSWYQCTPIDDPQRGYGCEYKGKWYPMVKEEKNNAPQQGPTVEEVEEDIVESDESEPLMPTVEDVE